MTFSAQLILQQAHAAFHAGWFAQSLPFGRITVPPMV